MSSVLFAACLAAVLTTPARFLLPTFVCGFVGRAVRDVCTGLGLNINWATMIAERAAMLPTERSNS